MTITPFFLAPSVILGLFPIRYLKHSLKGFEWIVLFISGIQMLIIALNWQNFVRKFFLSFFFNVVKTTCPQLSENSFKKFRREISASERPWKKSSNKDVSEKYDAPCCEANSIEVRNALNILQNLCLFQEAGNNMPELLQRFASLHVHDAARTQLSTWLY